MLDKVIFIGAAASSFLLRMKTCRDYFEQNLHSCCANEVFLIQTLTELFEMLTSLVFF